MVKETCTEIEEQTFIERYNLSKFVEKPSERKFNVEELERLIEEADSGIEGAARSRLCSERAQKLYSQLDPSFLSMKMKGKLNMSYRPYNPNHESCNVELTVPLFGVYFPNSSLFQITGEIEIRDERVGEKRERFDEELPEVFRENLVKSLTYQPSVKYYSGGIRYKWEATSTFEGLIPKEVKQVIESEKQFFEQGIYIIAEAQNWEIQYKAERIQASIGGGSVSAGDPLLVGVQSDEVFLIKEFDCTPMETYILKEFRQ